MGLCEALSHANPSTSLIQDFTLPCQRPWYVSNLQLHTDIGITLVSAEIYISSLLYHSRLAGHRNVLVATLPTPSTLLGG